jgi:hypothetical protein
MNISAKLRQNEKIFFAGGYEVLIHEKKPRPKNLMLQSL